MFLHNIDFFLCFIGFSLKWDMLLYDQGSLSWQTFYKAELRSIVFDNKNTKKNIADKMEILVQSLKFRTY